MLKIKPCAWLLLAASSSVGCASPWKIHGGPRECVQMCKNWDMDLSGMVGVGNQDASGPGATACVCQLRGAPASSRTEKVGGPGTTASTAAVIVALQEAERQRAESRKK